MRGVGSRFKSYKRKIRIEYREKKGVNIFIQRKKMYKNCCYLLNV